MNKEFKYDGDFMGSNGEHYVPDWAVSALEEGRLLFINDGVLCICEKVNVGDIVCIGDDGRVFKRMD